MISIYVLSLSKNEINIVIAKEDNCIKEWKKWKF